MKGCVTMHEENMHQSNTTSKDIQSMHQDKSMDASNCHRPKPVEPLPESSRPRRDGPGGEDQQ